MARAWLSGQPASSRAACSAPTIASGAGATSRNIRRGSLLSGLTRWRIVWQTRPAYLAQSQLVTPQAAGRCLRSPNIQYPSGVNTPFTARPDPPCDRLDGLRSKSPLGGLPRVLTAAGHRPVPEHQARRRPGLLGVVHRVPGSTSACPSLGTSTTSASTPGFSARPSAANPPPKQATWAPFHRAMHFVCAYMKR